MIKLKDMLPYDLFKQAWDEISRLVATNQWKIFETVTNDIHGEIAKKWLADNSIAIVRFNPTINEYMNQLMSELQKNNMMIIDPSNLRNNSDPFVIMLALYLEERDLANLRKKGNKKCCIPTREEPKKNRIDIPAICKYYDIPFMGLFSFMRHHGWQITVDVQNP